MSLNNRYDFVLVVDVPAIQSPVVTVTADNVVSVLIDSGYYNADLFTGLP